jgi:hypothetical protein
MAGTSIEMGYGAPPDTPTAVFVVTLYWYGGLAHFSRSVVGHIGRGSVKKTAQRVLGRELPM